MVIVRTGILFHLQFNGEFLIFGKIIYLVHALQQLRIPVIIETDKFTLKTGTQVGFTDEALVVGPAVKNGKSVDGRFAKNRIIIFVGRKRERAAAAGSY